MYRLIQSVAKRRYIGVGDGDNIKSIAYVENIVAATLFLMDRMAPGVETFNYADSPHMTTFDLVTSIATNLQVKLPAIRIPKPLALACAFPFDIVAKATKKDLPLTAKRIENLPTRPTTGRRRSAASVSCRVLARRRYSKDRCVVCRRSTKAAAQGIWLDAA